MLQPVSELLIGRRRRLSVLGGGGGGAAARTTPGSPRSSGPAPPGRLAEPLPRQGFGPLRVLLQQEVHNRKSAPTAGSQPPQQEVSYVEWFVFSVVFPRCTLCKG